jgi:L-rhamnose mutarotase
MKRYGSVIKVRPEAIQSYKAYHAAVWPEILATIRRSNIRNYSIFLKDDLLFGYYEYHGTDYQADMAKIASDPKTQEWWAIMEPMQKPLDTRAQGEWWAVMEEVFHTDWSRHKRCVGQCQGDVIFSEHVRESGIKPGLVSNLDYKFVIGRKLLQEGC